MLKFQSRFFNIVMSTFLGAKISFSIFLVLKFQYTSHVLFFLGVFDFFSDVALKNYLFGSEKRRKKTKITTMS